MIPTPNGSAPIVQSGRAPRVLVVDGDDTLTDDTRAQLEAAGYEVSTADMPDIGIVRRVEPDVIVLGVFYRGRSSGLDFLEHHASDPHTATVPIIVRVADETLDSGQRIRLTALNWPVVAPEAVTSDLLFHVRRLTAGSGP